MIANSAAPKADRRPGPFRVALVGCGRISGRHFEAIRNTPAMQLVGVCDEDERRVRAAAAAHGVPGFVSYDEMLEKLEADIVAVCTPSALHPQHGLMAAERGFHVLSEKPIATTLEAADALISGCDRAGVRLFVVKQNRLNPAVQLLKRALDKGRFGRLYMANITVRWHRPQDYYDAAAWRGTWEFDGGAVMNQASHHLDIMQWLVGPIESVFAFTGTLARSIEAEDSGVAAVRFRNGVIGSVEATVLTYPRNLEASVTVMGERGTAKVAGTALNRIDCWELAGEDEDDEAVERLRGVPDPDSVYGSSHDLYYAGMGRALRGEPCGSVDGREARKSLEIVQAIYESARTGRQVALPLAPRALRWVGQDVPGPIPFVPAPSIAIQ